MAYLFIFFSLHVLLYSAYYHIFKDSLDLQDVNFHGIWGFFF